MSRSHSRGLGKVTLITPVSLLPRGWIVRSLSAGRNACLEAGSCCTSLELLVLLLVADPSHPLLFQRPGTSPRHLGLEAAIRVPSLPAPSRVPSTSSPCARQAPVYAGTECTCLLHHNFPLLVVKLQWGRNCQLLWLFLGGFKEGTVGVTSSCPAARCH